MITQRPTEEMIAQWKAVWRENKDRLSPNRKTGAQVLEYLQKHYTLTELSDPEALKAIACDVTMNEYWAEKLPAGTAPSPRAFYLENEGAGRRFYLPENRDDPELWGGSVERIFVGWTLPAAFTWWRAAPCFGMNCALFRAWTKRTCKTSSWWHSTSKCKRE